MLEVMEKKKNWNMRVFASIAKAFDGLVDSDYRGKKGECCSAAALMFLIAEPGARNRIVEIIKLAEARGWDGSILDAARNQLFADREAGEIVAEAGKQTPPRTHRKRAGDRRVG